MSLDRDLPLWVEDLLEINPTDAVLEIGAGLGLGVELAAAKAPQGWVVGIDPSETMLAMARQRNEALIISGRITLQQGSADNLPLRDATFDKAMTMNSLHLWTDPVAGLREIHRVLKTGGRIAVGITRFSYASPEQFEPCLKASGFKNVRVLTGGAGTCAIAEV